MHQHLQISIIFCTFVATLHLEIRCKDTDNFPNYKIKSEKNPTFYQKT